MLHAIASQIGQTERDGPTISSTVLTYLAAAGLELRGATVPPWQGALLAWAAVRCGLQPPANPGQAISWLGWGGSLVRPQAGAVVVLTSAGRPDLQVGVAARVAGHKIHVIGAFDGAVCTRAFPIEQVVAARSPGEQSLISADVIDVAPVTVSIAPAPVAHVAQIAHTPAAPPEPSRPAPDDQVTMAHLQGLLKLVQSEFASVNHRIETVASNALAAVHITEDRNG